MLSRIDVCAVGLAGFSPGAALQLFGQRAGPGGGRIRVGDGVGGEEDVQLGLIVDLLQHLLQAFPHAFGEGLHESGVVEVLADLVDLQLPLESGLPQRDAEVFPVLPAG